MTRRNTNLAANNDLLNQYLTPAQLKRLERKSAKMAKNEISTGDKKERHHENRVANLKPLVPMTENQKRLLDSLRDNVQTVSIGPAGTGKTMCTTTWAAQAYLKGEFDKIVLTRPTVPISRSLGFKPGNLFDKLASPLAESLSILRDVLSPAGLEIAIKNNSVELVAFEDIRGRSFSQSIVILTESQNTTVPEMMAFVSRIGSQSKVIIEGDINQTDIHGENGLCWVLRLLEKNKPLQEYSGLIEFSSDDIVRSGLCKLWIKAIEFEYKQ